MGVYRLKWYSYISCDCIILSYYQDISHPNCGKTFDRVIKLITLESNLISLQYSRVQT